jgi:hypothetical protein
MMEINQVSMISSRFLTSGMGMTLSLYFDVKEAVA